MWEYDQTVKNLALALLSVLISATLSHSETMTGVVYSKEAGEGAHPSGSIDLAVGSTIHPMIWAPDLEDRRMPPGCEDIGAIWTVETDGSPSLPDVTRVTCKGVDKDAHDAWLLVRTFLEGLPNSGATSPTLSARYRSSPDYQRFAEQSKDFERSILGILIQIVSLDRAGRARLQSRVGIDIRGSPHKSVFFTFELVRNKRTAKWEIDGIEVEVR
jgi:hypothetical protein